MRTSNLALIDLEDSFPNGFHDALLWDMSLDLEGARLRLGLSLEISTTDAERAPSVYRRGVLEVMDLAAIVLGEIRLERIAPDGIKEMVEVAHDSAACHELARVLSDSSCFVTEVFLVRSNASLTFAGRGARWVWAAD